MSLVLTSAPAWAGKNKVAHTNVVAPAWQGSEVTLGIGRLTHMREHGGSLYVAGTEGIAAVSGDGQVLWTVPLPATAVRNVGVSDDLVAFTEFSVSGADPAEGFTKFVMGKLGTDLTFTGARVGAIGPDGTLLWTVDSASQTALSVPAISSSSVGVMLGTSFSAYDRADGHVVGSADLHMIGEESKFFGGMYDQATRPEPVVFGDAYYTGFFSWLLKYDLSGNLLDKSYNNGLTAPYVSITCGPVVFDGKVVFGGTGDGTVASRFFAVDDQMKGKWKIATPDTLSGCGSAYVSGDEVLFATNFEVTPVDKKGDIVWESVNKKGGLYPSQARGVRYPKSGFGVRKSYGDLLVGNDHKVWVATDNGGDVITVLDRASGAYVETLDVKQPLVAFALVGGKLAVATDASVRFLAAD